MAILFDQQLGSNAVSGNGTTLTLTLANAATAGDTINLGIGWLGAVSISTITGTGITGFSTDIAVANGTVNAAIVRLTAAGGIASSTVVTVTFSAAAGNRGVSGWTSSGVDTSSPVDTTASATPSGTTSWTAGACVTSTANTIVFGFAMVDDFGEGTSAPGSGWTEVPATAGDFLLAGQGDSWTAVYQIVSATGSYTPAGTWSGGSATTAAVSVAYKEAAAAVPPAVPRTFNAIPFIGGGL